MSEIIDFPTQWELLQARREAFWQKLKAISVGNVVYIDFNKEEEDEVA